MEQHVFSEFDSDALARVAQRRINTLFKVRLSKIRPLGGGQVVLDVNIDSSDQTKLTNLITALGGRDIFSY
ncbi:MAG: hypothetical protein IJL87_05400 [Clostridia bacterium]|nr:hypothetical protein [Clostridia bacterium]